MSKRYPSGFVSAFYDPLKNPDAPTIGTATAGDASASVPFTAPSNYGGSVISEYYAISDPGRVTASAASSPINVTGLTNGTPYTFQVWALNTYGPSAFSAASGSVTPVANPNRGLFGGGSNYSNVISFITISTTGNATDFGDLITTPEQVSSCASSTRGLFAGGLTSDASAKTNVIQYVTIATTGNAIDFGDLTLTRFGLAGCSNSTRGLFAGGNDNGRLTPDWVPVNVIDYVTIATTGNAIDFGDLQTNKYRTAACASSTRGVIAGGYTVGETLTNTIDYVTIASTGNALDFGDLYVGAVAAMAGCSNSTRGLFGGGNGTINVIQYITIATTGNSIDFGDLLSSIQLSSACASSTRGVWGGGSSATNVIQYVTIASTGNAIDFGDLISPTQSLAACSSAHGGL